MRKNERPTRTETTRGKLAELTLPRGAGSIQMRRRNYWLVYRDAEGVLHQTNAWTADEREATRLLLDRVIVTARARLAQLEAMRNEADKSAHGRSSEHPRPRRAARASAQAGVRDRRAS